jgi:predicted RND superfamily exporter protein
MSTALASLYQQLVLRKALWVLIVLLALVGFLGSYIPSLKMDASADALVLEGDKSLEYYREISKRYGTEDFLIVTYQPNEGGLLSDKHLALLDELRGRLAQLPNVSGVTSILDVPLLESPPVTLGQVAAGEIPTLRTPGIDKSLVAKELATSPIYKSLLTSVDGSTTALQVNLERDARYHELLNKREALRDKDNAGTISAVEAQKLEGVEQEFSEYLSQIQNRQADLVSKARTILDDYRGDAQLFLGGVPMIAVDMIDFVKSDLKVFGSGILLFIVALLVVIFRSLRWVLIPLSTCVITVVFMMGLLSFLDWKLTVISANFVALLLIITLAITIHLVVRYREISANSPGLGQFERVSETVSMMARPCIYTALTTLVAFGSLVISGIRPVIDFGWMMTIGVVVAMVVSFVVLPAILMLLPAKEEKGGAEGEGSLTRYFAMITQRFGGGILLVALALLALSVWGVTQLKVENRFIDYFNEDTEIYQGMETIDAELGGTIALDIVIDGPVYAEPAGAVVPEDDGEFSGDFSEGPANNSAAANDFDDEFADDFSDDAADFSADFNDDFNDDFGDDVADFGAGNGAKAKAAKSDWFSVAGLRRVKEVHDYVDGLDETGKVLSLATFYDLMGMVMGNVDDLQLALASRALPASISDILIDPYFSAEADQVRISLRVKETSRSLRRDELLKQVRHHLVDELGFSDEQVHLTGMLVLYNNMLQSLFSSQILTLSAVFVAILVMFMVLFRSVTLALIALAPNLLAAGMVLGSMGLAGIPLDMMTITIAAITVGIGVDHAIHYVHRFMAEFPVDRNYIDTMYRCHASIGRAMYYTSVIIIFGFSILALSNFTPSIYFGLLTAGAMLAALLGSMMLLPKLILLIKPMGPESERD